MLTPHRRRSLALLVLTALVAASAPMRAAADGDLYDRMQHVNASLTSYQADVTAAVSLHSPPYISPVLNGTAYYRKPDQAAVNFHTIPLIAAQAKHVVGQLEAPIDWPHLYDVTPTGDDGTTSTFRLVRKKNGRIDHVDVKVDDKTATVTAMTYIYKDSGGTIAFTQTYDEIGHDFVVKDQVGKVDIPHVSADVHTTFSNYKINVPVPDSVFASE